MEKSEPEIPNRGKTTQPASIRDFTTTPLPIPKIFLVVYLLNLRSECLVSYDPHFPGNDGTKKKKKRQFRERLDGVYYAYYGSFQNWRIYAYLKTYALEIYNSKPDKYFACIKTKLKAGFKSHASGPFCGVCVVNGK